MTGDPSDGLRLTLVVRDAETVAELERLEGAEREVYALTALRIGVLALRQVRGEVDAQVLREEGRHLLDNVRLALEQHQKVVQDTVGQTLREYFDPTSGRFSERVRRLVAQDGELEQILRSRLEGDESTLGRTLASQVGANSPLMRTLDPATKDGLVDRLSTTVDQVVRENQDRIVGQFDMNDPASALRRFIDSLKKENLGIEEALGKRVDDLAAMLSLDVPNSALARVQKTLLDTVRESEERNAAFREEVKRTLAEMSARKAAEERSTTHGHDFESTVYDFVIGFSERHGDVARHTGNTTGVIRNCKKGDVVVELGRDHVAHGARVVVEAKESASYDLNAALDEMDEAAKNRQSSAAVFVCSSKTATPEMPRLRRHGTTVVVTWDPDDPATDPYLEAGLSIARFIATAAKVQGTGAPVDPDHLERSIRAVEKQANALDDITTWSETIRTSAGKIVDKVRVVRTALDSEVRRLDDWAESLRDSL